MTTIPATQINADHLGRHATITTGGDTISGALVAARHDGITETLLSGDTAVYGVNTTLTIVHGRGEIEIECTPRTEIVLRED